jgi:hypothetical protein
MKKDARHVPDAVSAAWRPSHRPCLRASKSYAQAKVNKTKQIIDICLKCGNRLSPKLDKVHMCSTSISSSFRSKQSKIINAMLREQKRLMRDRAKDGSA